MFKHFGWYNKEKKIMSNKRILYWDVSKAIAIFLVVWGHCLQNLTTESNYWLYDGVSQCIISFHMPAFMLISGYFAYSSLAKPFGKVIIRKAQQLLIPSITWFLIVSLIAMILHRDFTFDRLYMVLTTLPYSYWFLKSLFMCYLLTMIGVLLLRWKAWMLWLYLTCLLLCAESLNYVSCISMYPFFGAGLLYHHFQKRIDSHFAVVLVISFCCYITFFSMYDSVEYNLYFHPFEWSLGGAESYVIRCILGLSGSAMIILLMRWTCEMFSDSKYVGIIAKVGSMTLGIYCIQVILAEGAFSHFSSIVDNMNSFYGFMRYVIYDMVITPFAAFLTIVFCYLVIGYIRKSKYARLILLGEK